MLSKPVAGWTDISIGSFKDRASYLTDVPVDCLRSMISAYRNPSLPFCVFFDAEGWDYTVIVDHYETSVIHRKEDTVLHTFSTDRDTLADQLVSDIENHLEDWIEWEPGYDDGEDFDNRISLFESLISDLKSEIQKWKARYSRTQTKE